MRVVKQTILFLIFSLLVCSATFYAGIYIPSAFDAAVKEEFHSDQICSESGSETRALCVTYNATKALPYVAAGTFILTIFSIVFVHVLGTFSSRNRKSIFNLFRPGLLIAKSLACLLVALNIGLMTFSIFSLEYLLHTKIHYWVILSTLGIGIYALAMIIYKSFQTTDSPVDAPGINLLRSENPNVWSFVEGIAEKLKAPMPDNIVAGLSPTFWVTEYPVSCDFQKSGESGDITGRTLFISLPFCRVLSETELSAVIAHEFGHYIGEDTVWTRKFAPLYRKIENTIENMGNDQDNLLVKLAMAPARLLMKIFFNAFDESVSLIQRDRELAADGFSAKNISRKELASALIKLHIFGYCWDDLLNVHPKYFGDNLSKLFARMCRNLSWEIDWHDALMTHTAHPTDTHPALATRLAHLEADFDSLLTEIKDTFQQTSSIAVVDDAEEFEKVISELTLSSISQFTMPEEGWIQLADEEPA